MKTRRMRKNKRTRSKRGGGGCFGAFCSTNNATKNVINVSKMDIAALNNKHIELLLSRGIKTTKFVETSDPKVRDRLEKEISELDKEIKVYEDAIAKETRRMNENGAKSTATFDRVHQQMKNANPVHSQNYSEFFKDIKRPTPISGGGGCLGAFCSTNNATKNVINVSKMNVNEIVEKIKGLLLKVFAIGTAPEQKKQHMAEVSVYMNELNKQSKSTVPATREAAIAAIKNVSGTVVKMQKDSLAATVSAIEESKEKQRRGYDEVQEMKRRAGIE